MWDHMEKNWAHIVKLFSLWSRWLSKIRSSIVTPVILLHCVKHYCFPPCSLVLSFQCSVSSNAVCCSTVCLRYYFMPHSQLPALLSPSLPLPPWNAINSWALERLHNVTGQQQMLYKLVITNSIYSDAKYHKFYDSPVNASPSFSSGYLDKVGHIKARQTLVAARKYNANFPDGGCALQQQRKEQGQVCSSVWNEQNSLCYSSVELLSLLSLSSLLFSSGIKAWNSKPLLTGRAGRINRLKSLIFLSPLFSTVANEALKNFLRFIRHLMD